MRIIDLLCCSGRRASSLEGMTEDQRRVHLEEERIFADGLALVVSSGGCLLAGVEAELRWKMAAVASENTNEIPGCYLGWDRCESLNLDEDRALDQVIGGWFDQVET